MPHQVAPAREDPLVHEASELVGGPLGRHAARGRHGRLVAPLVLLLLATTVTFGLGYMQKRPCRNHAWTNNYQYTRLCYSDVYALYFTEGLVNDDVPYVDYPTEYPVLTGTVMWAAAIVAPLGDAAAYFDVTALMMLGCALVVTVAVVRSAGNRPWDAALFALSPLLLFHGLTNWDLLAVAFAALAVACWAKRWPVLAGICLGLGTAAKLYPILFVVPLVALCWRANRLRAGAVAAATAIGTTIAVNVPYFFFSARLLPGPHPDDPPGACHGLFDPERAWWQFINLNRCRAVDWDSLWFQAQQRLAIRGVPLWPGVRLRAEQVNSLSLALFIVALAAIVVLIATAPRRPRLPQVLFLALAAFLLVNKVWSPQYSIWLVPLAALARPRWRMLLAWQAAELWLVVMRFYYLIHIEGERATPVKDIGVELGWFSSAVLVRDALLVGLCALIVREIRRPHLDVVRRSGADDPAGGVLDEAPDRWDEPVQPTVLVGSAGR